MSPLPRINQKLLIVDGLSIVRRVYEAVKGDDTPERADGALKSSWFSILRALREHEPTHFLAAFDHRGPTWRHELYPEYKANRRPMAQALTDAMPEFIEHLNNSGLRSLSVPGVEADDTMSTLAVRAVSRGFDVVVLTSDKDMYFLLEHGVQVYDHFMSEWRDHDWIRSHFGVEPAQMTDFLALMGDETDGIPGIEQVGIKTAAKLLNQFGTLDAVLDNAHLIAGKLGEKIRSSVDIARLSRQLATVDLDVDIGISPRDIVLPASLISLLSIAPEPKLVRTSLTAEMAVQHLAAQQHPPAAPQARRLRA